MSSTAPQVSTTEMHVSGVQRSVADSTDTFVGLIRKDNTTVQTNGDAHVLFSFDTPPLNSQQSLASGAAAMDSTTSSSSTTGEDTRAFLAQHQYPIGGQEDLQRENQQLRQQLVNISRVNSQENQVFQRDFLDLQRANQDLQRANQELQQSNQHLRNMLTQHDGDAANEIRDLKQENQGLREEFSLARKLFREELQAANVEFLHAKQEITQLRGALATSDGEIARRVQLEEHAAQRADQHAEKLACTVPDTRVTEEHVAAIEAQARNLTEQHGFIRPQAMRGAATNQPPPRVAWADEMENLAAEERRRPPVQQTPPFLPVQQTPAFLPVQQQQQRCGSPLRAGSPRRAFALPDQQQRVVADRLDSNSRPKCGNNCGRDCAVKLDAPAGDSNPYYRTCATCHYAAKFGGAAQRPQQFQQQPQQFQQFQQQPPQFQQFQQPPQQLQQPTPFQQLHQEFQQQQLRDVGFAARQRPAQQQPAEGY
jgi:hypothetical protein